MLKRLLKALISIIFDRELLMVLIGGVARVWAFFCLEFIIITREPLHEDLKFWLIMALVFWNFDTPITKVNIITKGEDPDAEEDKKENPEV